MTNHGAEYFLEGMTSSISGTSSGSTSVHEDTQRRSTVGMYDMDHSARHFLENK